MLPGKNSTCRNFRGLKSYSDCSTASQYKPLRDIKDDISFLFARTFLFEWNSFSKYQKRSSECQSWRCRALIFNAQIPADELYSRTTFPVDGSRQSDFQPDLEETV